MGQGGSETVDGRHGRTMARRSRRWGAAGRGFIHATTVRAACCGGKVESMGAPGGMHMRWIAAAMSASIGGCVDDAQPLPGSIGYQSDPANCGFAGNRCDVDAGAVCRGGRCIHECPPGLITCAGSLRFCRDDLARSHGTCGRCNLACAEHEACVEGACVPCSEGRISCGIVVGEEQCAVDSSNDAHHCGGCDIVCPSYEHSVPRCVDGTCTNVCEAGWGDCDGGTPRHCVDDLRSSRSHCGACGSSCVSGEWCRDGSCVPERVEDLPASRLIAPISYRVSRRARPTFRWELPEWSIASGARLEICRDRECARLVHTQDATGTEVTPSVALPMGTLFWRVTTLADANPGRRVSPTWVLYVEPDEGCRLDQFEVRGGDYDGDGARDGVTTVVAHEMSVGYSTGIAETTLTLPPDSCESTLSCHMDSFASGTGIGDISGDGYGDFVALIDYAHHAGTYHAFGRRWTSYLGGAPGLVAPGWARGGSADERQRADVAVAPTGDIDRDGYGDVLETVGATALSQARWVFLTHAQHRWEIPTHCDIPRLMFADFNGDDVLDVATLQCHEQTRAFPVSGYAIGSPTFDGFLLFDPLPACEARGVRLGNAVPENVLDVDCDGYSDLIARDLTAPAGTVRFALLGGPDGLSSARCMALPAAP